MMKRFLFPATIMAGLFIYCVDPAQDTTGGADAEALAALQLLQASQSEAIPTVDENGLIIPISGGGGPAGTTQKRIKLERVRYCQDPLCLIEKTEPKFIAWKNHSVSKAHQKNTYIATIAQPTRSAV